MTSWFKITKKALALLGANAFFCLALEPTGANGSDHKLTIMSYNIQNYFVEGEKTAKPQTPKDLERVQAVHHVILIYQPDILAIQEIGGSQALKQLQESLAKKGLNLPYSLLYTGIDTVRQQAILSKYPIIQNYSNPYWSYQLNKQLLLMNRGILDVELQTPLGVIRCLAVHLKSQRFSPIAHQKDIRYQETLLLKQHIEATLKKKEDTQLIVLGDFNDTLNSEPIKLIRSIKYSKKQRQALYPGYSMTNKSNTSPIWTQYWAYQGIYSKFDYIWITQNLRELRPKYKLSESKVSLLASDHRACILSF